MNDRDWLIPSIALTLLSGIVAFALIPGYAGILPAIGVLPYWMVSAAVLAGGYALANMARAGVKDPVAHLRRTVIAQRREVGFISLGIVIAGLNLTTFMWTKPLLNYLVPFWADPMLTDIDHWIFFGNDPWVFLTWLNTDLAATFYHKGWFVMMLATLLFVLAAPPSAKKSAVMLTYFMLWSVIGPAIHILLPAAGPVFFADLQLGDRFVGLHAVSETREVADYLWNIYSVGGFGPGAGISAMPSLHIATTGWMLVAVAIFARRWLPAMAIAGALIFLLSIALGWHYAVDGLVGGAAAVGCYALLHAVYRAKAARQERQAPLSASFG